MKLAVDMLGLWMISWFLSECYGASVVTQYLQWVQCTWNHAKLSDEVPGIKSYEVVQQIEKGNIMTDNKSGEIQIGRAHV